MHPRSPHPRCGKHERRSLANGKKRLMRRAGGVGRVARWAPGAILALSSAYLFVGCSTGDSVCCPPGLAIATPPGKTFVHDGTTIQWGSPCQGEVYFRWKDGWAVCYSGTQWAWTPEA